MARKVGPEANEAIYGVETLYYFGFVIYFHFFFITIICLLVFEKGSHYVVLTGLEILA